MRYLIIISLLFVIGCGNDGLKNFAKDFEERLEKSREKNKIDDQRKK